MKINLIQFTPYFPPHKWWLETVSEELWKFYTQNNFWEVINVTFDVGQEINNPSPTLPLSLMEGSNKEYINSKSGNIIGYRQKGYIVYLLPSFDIIPNFPVPKFWKKEFWEILRETGLKIKIDRSQEKTIIQTHTRFFLSSLLGWLFAKFHKLKWVHIEHGSDYVILSSKLKNKVSYLYDRLIGKWIFKKADAIVAISEACKKFINNEFFDREVSVFYRWLEIPEVINQKENLKEKFPWKIIIWFVWRLMKWKNVESLIKSYYLIDNSLKEKIQIVIVWDWEDFERLKKIDTENSIYFTWWQNFIDALSYQKQFDIHIHSSSPGWWLATTLLQAMYFWCFIIATPNEWANEVIKNNYNWFLLKNDSINEIKKWIEGALNLLEKREEFSQINKEFINIRFQRDENIKKYFSLYNEL